MLWIFDIKPLNGLRVLSNFYHNRPISEHFKSQKEDESKCNKSFMKTIQKQYYHKNKTSLIEKQKNYNFKNKELIKNQKREYYLKNKEIIREKQRRYRVQNKETIKQLNQKYRSQNKDTPQYKDAQARYRAQNKEKRQHTSKQYYQFNKLTLNQQNKIYRLRNKLQLDEQNRVYYLKEKQWIHHLNKQYYRKNKISIKMKNKEYYQRNKQLINERNREYYLKNKPFFELHSRQYYFINKNFIKLRNTLYYLRNKDSIKMNASLKRQLKPTKNELVKDLQYLSLFFGYANVKLFVCEELDWYRISHLQMNGIGGGSVLAGFGNLGRALEWVYPEIQWIQSKFSIRRKKAIQRWLRVMLQQILPENTQILEDYLHPDLLWSSKQKMELDIWVPKYNLALEYQGEQHYYDHSFYGSLDSLKERDEKKKRSCFERGITLIAIPYWWDRTKESLAETLKNHSFYGVA